MLDHFFQAEVARGAGQIRCDDIPSDSPVGHVIERAETTGMGKRMLISRGHGSAERQVLRDRCQARDNHQRVICRSFDSPLHGCLCVTSKDIIEAQNICEKQHVEVGLISDACLVGPELESAGGQAFIRRMRPQARCATAADAGLFVEGKQ
ncbi:hypothetical protein D3C80_1359370 [compost metagenome]